VEQVFSISDSFRGFSGTFDNKTLQSLSESDKIVSIEPARQMNAFEAVQSFPPNWGLARISSANSPRWHEFVFPEQAG
jgi:hypothetical protein